MRPKLALPLLGSTALKLVLARNTASDHGRTYLHHSSQTVLLDTLQFSGGNRAPARGRDLPKSHS